jgi:hypothetical protein
MGKKYSAAVVVVLSLIGLAAGVDLAREQTADDLFNPAALHELRLFVNSRSLAQLRARVADETFVPADLQWHSTRVRNVAVRSHGFGSRDPNKPGLLIDFSRYAAGQTFAGLGSLILDNLGQDPSMVRERITMAFIARMGQPASRVSFCQLFITNVNQGVYAIVENVDSDYLMRHLAENSGYLFEYDRVSDRPDTVPGEVLAASRTRFEPRTHTLEPDSALFAPIRNLFREVDGPADAVWRERVSQYLDLRQLMIYVAIETFMSEVDGFSSPRGMNNFFFYRRNGTAKHSILPRDKDTTMARADSSIWFPAEGNVLFRRAAAFSDLRELYFQTLEACARTAAEGGWLEAEVTRSVAVVAAAARADTHKPFTNDEFDAATQFVKDFARRRSAFVSQEVLQARAGPTTAPALRPQGGGISADGDPGPAATTSVSSDPRSRSRNGRDISGTAVGRQTPATTTPPAGGGSAPAGLPLVQKTDLTYVGAFRLPASGQYPSTFDYGGQGLVYFSENNSLLLAGADIYGLVAEVDIPAPATGALGNLPRAGMRQPYTDVLDGKRLTVDGDKNNGAYIGGLLPAPPYLIVSVYDFYDGTANQSKSHFRTNLKFGAVAGQVVGPVQVGNNQAGFVSGYMTTVPAAWQAALGGSALTGNCCLSIISRTSLGPSVSVFNPADVGGATPVPATRLLGYPLAHPTIGAYDPPGELFNGAVTMGGVAFPAGTRSVLFFGRKPTSKANYCYGEGTPNPALDRQPVPGTNGQVIYCYDPVSSAKGTHGYPYTFFVWAYDANDLVAVKQGKKQTWEPVPYATWGFDLPFQTSTGYGAGRQIKGVAYDPATQRIYLTAEGQDGCCTPLVHVFTIAGLAPTQAPLINSGAQSAQDRRSTRGR